LFPGDALARIFFKFSETAVELSRLLRRELVIKVTVFFENLFGNFVLLFRRQLFDLFENFCRAHVHKVNRCEPFCKRMIPREIIKKIRQIEIRTNRLVTESLAGAYHSVFKGQGMNFDEVREYQPGDDVRTIDWNVTARMNHPFIKKFVEERELTLMLLVDVSGSGLFGSRAQSKRELAAEIASVLAFSAIRNNDKVGLLLFTDEVEKFIPPRKGRGHVLRVIREVLFFEPKRRGTDLVNALEFMGRVLPHRSIAVVVSDFQTPQSSGPLPLPIQTALRIANRRHDVVTVQITDRYEMQLPALGRLTLEDAETGEILEINTSDPSSRDAFALRRQKQLNDLARQFRSSGIDSIQLRTDESYSAALGNFFETRERRRLRG
jgi:uncharacterized protein (DUF58 family)